MKIKIVKKLKAKMNRYLGRVADDREPDRKRSDDCFRKEWHMASGRSREWQFGMESLLVCRNHCFIVEHML